MAFGLNNFSDYSAIRNTSIEIKKVMNGYIFELNGFKLSVHGKSRNWDSFRQEFIYVKLEDGLKEVDSFFKDIEKFMKQKNK